jgi:hypothetical protein
VKAGRVVMPRIPWWLLGTPRRVIRLTGARFSPAENINVRESTGNQTNNGRAS